MIEIQGGITIGPGIQIGDVQVLFVYFTTEDSNQLITEDNLLLVED